MALELTVEALGTALFRGPTAFYDGRNGMARQDFQCVAEPRFGYFWKREDRNDRGRQAYMVDGDEVADLSEACRKLALPPDPGSHDEVRKHQTEEFESSPKLNYGATRALSEARCNADGGPFGMIRAWLHRSGDAWHGGMNAYADMERAGGREFPHWIYKVKYAAHETSRAMYLHEADRKTDNGLTCAMGVRCRDCPILQQVEKSMVAARTWTVFPKDIEDSDIDAAKTWVCIGHILDTKTNLIDGAFFSTQADRDDDHNY